MNHTCDGLLGQPTAIVAIPPRSVAPTATKRQYHPQTPAASPALPPAAPPIPPTVPIAAPPTIPIAAPPATPIAAPATPVTPPSPQPQQPQQPQQLRTHTPPEPAVPSVEQGPRQGPRYSKEVATIAKIYTDNKLVTTCQGVPACYITISNLLEDPA